MSSTWARGSRGSHSRTSGGTPSDESLGEALKASAKLLYGRGAERTAALREGAGPLLAVGRRTLRKKRS